VTFPQAAHIRPQAIFHRKLGLSERLMERCLGEALSAGGDYADLYFESVTSTSLASTSPWSSRQPRHQRRLRHPRHFRRAHRLRLHRRPLVRTGCCAPRAPRPSSPAAGQGADVRLPPYFRRAHALPHCRRHAAAEVAAKLLLIQRADKAARDFDPRITQVRAGFQRRASPHPGRSLRRTLRAIPSRWRA